MVGAELVTALIGTAPRVWHGVEKLAGPEDLDALLAGLALSSGGRVLDPAQLEAVRQLRSELRTIVDGAEEGEAIRLASALTARARASLTLTGEERWRWTYEATGDLADELAGIAGVGLLGVLRTLGVERFRACAAPDCEGAFVDASRSGRRRYCMPDLCGNRVNVARHRARRRGASPS
jgi:predicted RNA-binding Zn ribbon-like protein